MAKVVASFTRKEAINKCYGINHPECFVQALEAMGLIEFKPEPVNVNRDRFKLAMRGFGYMEGSKGFQDALDAYDSIYT